MQTLFPIDKSKVNFSCTYQLNIGNNKIFYHFGNEVGVFQKCTLNSIKGYEFLSENGNKYLISNNKREIANDYDATFSINEKDITIHTLISCKKKLVDAKIPNKTNITDTWQHSFNYKKEIRDEKDKIIQFGLRPPQLGALHAIQAHWSMSDKPGIIIMPTGTGKTETMICLAIAEQCGGLLIIVPSDSLRTQIADKFITLGLLKEPKFSIVNNSVLYPIVGYLKSGIKNVAEAKELFQSNVIVSTPQLISGILEGKAEIKNEFLKWCNTLIMDEAHHSPAKQWKIIKDTMVIASKKVLLFTATPFRNDKGRLDGNILFNYPLSLAQRDKYFKNIEFYPILEFNNTKAEKEIAKKAVKLLLEDREKGFDHILMARVDERKEAERIYNEIYKELKDLNPVYIHSGLKTTEKKEILQSIKNGEHKIIVCVDMLGEGFDLPQLKICALHDLHKNITTSFQFFGRFTRESQLKLGHAKIIANIADPNLKGTLKKLYKKDSDWDKIISHANEGIIQNVIEEEQFFKNFSDAPIPNKIPLRNITPAMSTVVFRIYDKTVQWNPDNYKEYFKDNKYETVSVEHSEQYLQVLIVKTTDTVKWGKIDDLLNCGYDLYIIYLNQDQNLLYINSSNNGTTHNRLAESIVGKNITLFSEADIYKCLDGIFQLELFNLGLKSILNGPISFTMYAGNGIINGLDELDNNTKASSNLFGVGYENGNRISIGCSSKGRVWTKLVKTIPDFCNWCDALGVKLLDPSIDTKDIFRFIQKPEQIIQIPSDKTPVSIKWNEQLFFFPTLVNFGLAPIVDQTIELVRNSDTTIQFTIRTESTESKYQLILENKPASRGYEYSLIEGYPISVNYKNTSTNIIDIFYEFPPIIWFHDNSKMYNNIFFPFKGNINLFDLHKIMPFDWTGIDIRKESQKKEKRSDSIQYRIIQRLKSDNEYKIIFDDDDANEASDIIAVKYFESTTNKIIFELYHCKYSSKSQTGGRLKDLYEVCGQAQRSYHWKHNAIELTNHMIRRNNNRINRGEISRYEHGGDEELHIIQNMLTSGYCDTEFNVFVVQPGISKSQIEKETEHLKLFGATDLLLKKTGNEFYVISSS